MNSKKNKQKTNVKQKISFNNIAFVEICSSDVTWKSAVRVAASVIRRRVGSGESSPEWHSWCEANLACRHKRQQRVQIRTT